ncbi:lipase family protein [Pseudomonas nunensis]|uniref:lipase family protein n=1 Tax=Pseudomonas nunensis TaxID=2961896 RepID=UPI0025AF9002|nr:lipase family protein [Pseudomonas nunensis]MDN3221526.1 lipase family protein [Pseudomonas nunensis]
MTSIEKPLLNDKRLGCPVTGQWISFRLVDEFGDGTPYSGLDFEAVDSEGAKHNGTLDSDGYARLEGCYSGPLVLSFPAPYKTGVDVWYERLMVRTSYKLAITALQAAAEQTLHRPEGVQTKGHYRASAEKGKLYQVEVRDLVLHSSHLPPPAKLSFPLPSGPANLTKQFYNPTPTHGISLLPEKHYVLEVRALRAFRPLISISPEFNALNLYQMSILSTLSYGEFGQSPDEKIKDDTIFTYPKLGTIGHVLQTQLACGEEPKYYADASKAWFPLVEDVPYSKRLEIVPYDPNLYSENQAGENQETPSTVHFFNDSRNGMTDFTNTDTQAYATHDDRMILISVRGTQENWDKWRDADAQQVPIDGGTGKAHQGFHEGYLAVRKFVAVYLDRFRTADQRVMVCGHSLGGAIALLLAEWIRNNYDKNVILYTFGSPRAGDSVFVESAKALIHHRIVNHNDPVPSVPAPWMSTHKSIWSTGAALVVTGASPPVGGIFFAAGLTRIGGTPYWHQGEQRHFMPVKLPRGIVSSVLWKPGCEGIEEAAMTKCIRELADADMPARASFIGQIFSAAEHSMLGGYIPNCWATFKRWQEAQSKGGTVVTETERNGIATDIQQYQNALKQWEQSARDEYPGGVIYGRPQDRATIAQQRMSYSDLENRQKEINAAIQYNKKELAATDNTLDHIRNLTKQKLLLADVYGDRSELPKLQNHIDRWFAHEENQASVRVAQIPQTTTSSTA